MTEFTVSAAGDTVAFDHVPGASGGPALIFIAGAGPSRQSDPLTTATAELVASAGVSTIVYDRLGRGESVAAGDLTLDRELSAIAALIDVAGGTAVLCGHSSGSSIALAAAASGLAVTGLVLFEAPIGSISGGAGPWSAEINRRIDSGDLEGAQVHYMKDMPPEWLAGARSSPMWPAIYGQVGTLRADGESLAWADSAPLSQLFAGIRVPVEVIVGTATMPIMTVAADTLVAALPSAVGKRIAGANHSWEAEAMAAELVEFVAATAR